MQIIIDIPEDVYRNILEIPSSSMFAVDCDIDIRKGIQNGTPLPKGHGRLMDYGYVVDAIDDWVNAGEYNYTNATDYLRNRIRNVPTIIEADKESEGEE